MVTLNARVRKQQVAQEDSLAMSLVQLALPNSETLLTGCLPIPLVSRENSHTSAAAMVHCIDALLAGQELLCYTHLLRPQESSQGPL